MKTLIVLLYLLPLSLLAQRNTDNYGKFVAADGVIIKGTVTARGYERQIEVNNLQANNSGNNTTIRFSMPIDGATGIFRNMLNSKQKLRSGEIAITTIVRERTVVSYKINMEDITVEECVDDNGNTSLVLKATRIGWTYFTTDRAGRSVVSSKTGWDASTQKAWTNF